MSRTIWKYQLNMSETVQAVDVPSDNSLLLVDYQHGRPTLWYEVDTESRKTTKRFMILGTGWEFPKDKELQHQGSIMVDGGFYVWHIYEVIE